MFETFTQDAGTVANSGASAAVVGVQFAGMGLPDWVALISGIYFVISTGFLIMKVAAWRKDRNEPKAKTDSCGPQCHTGSGCGVRS